MCVPAITNHHQLETTHPVIISQLPWVQSPGTAWLTGMFCLGSHEAKVSPSQGGSPLGSDLEALGENLLRASCRLLEGFSFSWWWNRAPCPPCHCRRTVITTFCWLSARAGIQPGGAAPMSCHVISSIFRASKGTSNPSPACHLSASPSALKGTCTLDSP